MNLFQVAAQVKDWNTDVSQGGCLVDGVPTLKCMEVVMGNLLFMSGTIVMIVIFAMFVLGGYYYLTSFGDPAKIKKAQGTLRYALIGFVLYISAFLILRIIDTVFLGGAGNIFNFEIGVINPPTPTP